ncbi:MAG TPA: sigma-70 family RNA polymerase sigma factor [Bryobacteraceae bacterium]|nr:sigma-70 family RNA polymerase sigma factor [Bryobacteraceae bacterium]
MASSRAATTTSSHHEPNAETTAPTSDFAQQIVSQTISNADEKDASEDNNPAAYEAEQAASVDWPELVSRIRCGDISGMEDLYRLFGRGIRFYLCRQLGVQELDDKVHDTFLIVVQAILRGDLREPERLMGFVRTVVRRQVAAHIDQVVHSRREELHLDVGVRVVDAKRNPEQHMAFQQKVDFMVEILDRLSKRDREILTRFYLHEQTQEQICQEMNLTETQFRLLKSRAKARFGELGKRKLQQKTMAPFFSRISVGS